MTLKRFRQSTVTAWWVAGFDDLDQPLRVGGSGSFLFFNHSPMGHPRGQTFAVPPGALVFWNTLLGPNRHQAHERTATVTAIEHARLGSVRRVASDGRGSYEARGGDNQLVTFGSADQDPPDEWVFRVTLQDVSNAQPVPSREERVARAEAEGSWVA